MSFSFQLAFAAFESDQALIKKAAEFLSPEVVMKMFKKENLDMAYAQAQREDFEPGEAALITKAMAEYLSMPLSKCYEELAKYEGFGQLKFISELPKDEKMALLQVWRYEFLIKVMDAIRYRNSLKPTLKFALSSLTQYDSNVNREPEDANVGSAISSSGKDDWQQLFLVHADWEPFVNCKKFPRDLKFSQSFNVITVSQVAHKENEVFIVETEPKVSKTFDSYFQKLSLAYRFQYFGYSGDQDSRQANALFQDHRFKVQMDTKTVPFFFLFDTEQSAWYVSYSDKQHFNSSDKSRDANDLRVGIQSILTRKSNRLKGLLEYSDYQSDTSVISEYKYLSAKLTNYHSAKVNALSTKLNFSEEVGYRIKSWSDFNALRANRDEDTYYIDLKVTAPLTKKSTISFNVKQLYREREEQTVGNEEANQTIIGLGLNWRTH